MYTTDTEQFGKKYPSNCYARGLTKAPMLISVFVTFLMLATLPFALLFDFKAQADIEGFHPIHSTALRNNHYIELAKKKATNLNSASLVVVSNQTKRTIAGQFTFIFAVNQNYNVFHPYVIQKMKDFVSLIYDIDVYRAICWNDDSKKALPSESSLQRGCTPINSILQYFYPGVPVMTDTGVRMTFDGLSNFHFTKSSFDLIKSNPFFDWYFDLHGRLNLTRMVVSIGTPVVYAKGGVKALKKSTAIYIAEKLKMALENVLSIDTDFSSLLGFNAYMGGFSTEDMEISRELLSDFKFSFVSLIFAIVILAIYIKSLIIALFSTAQLITSFSLTQIIAYFVLGTNSLNILSILSYYVAQIILLTGQMVLFGFFKSSGLLGGARRALTVEQRVAYMLRHGGKAICVAFSCLLFSFLIASTLARISFIRDFSQLMLIHIVICFFLLMVVTPSTILMHHYRFSNKRRNLQKQRELMLEGGRARSANQIALHREINQVYISNSFLEYDDMVCTGNTHLIKEIETRGERKGIIWTLNIKPFFAKVTAAFSKQELTGFENLDEDNYVRSPEYFSPVMTSLVRMKRLNCENKHQCDINELEALANSAKSTPKLAEKFGVEACGSKGHTRQELITRLAKHHIKRHGWAFNCEKPQAVKNFVEEGKPPEKEKHPLLVFFLHFPLFQRFYYRDRKYCWGLCGPHDESEVARRARIQELTTKIESYNMFERFFAGPLLRFIKKLKYYILVILTFFAIVCCVLSGFLSVNTIVPKLLPEDSMIYKYNEIIKNFDAKSCDYCSPYFSFRHLEGSPSEYCNEGDTINIFKKNKPCGSCGACPICDNDRGHLDSCSQCLLSDDERFNDCLSCSDANKNIQAIQACSHCPNGLGGPQCDISCRLSCKSSCYPLTGACIDDFPPTAECGNRGRKFSRNEVPKGAENQCICAGMFFGPECEFCRCQNGGKCDPMNGKCICPPQWAGPTCNKCPITCQNNGYCAVSLEPEQYPYYQCRETFCSLHDLLHNGATTPLCQRCEEREKTGCNIKTKTCDKDIYRALNESNKKCMCNGLWHGEACDKCSASTGICDANGNFQACDGFGRSTDGSFPLVDKCGQCGGLNSCYGCDFVRGSGARMDACGNCGGSRNECYPESFFDVLIEINKSLTVADFLEIGARCEAFILNVTNIQNVAFGCPLQDFIAVYGVNLLTDVNRQFSTFIPLLKKFLINRNNIETVGIENNSITFVINRYRVKNGNFRRSISFLTENYDRAIQAVTFLKTGATGNIIIGGPLWEAIAMQRYILFDSLLIILVSFIFTIGAISIYTISWRIILPSAILLAFSTLALTATVSALRFKMGAVEIVAFLFSFNIAQTSIIFLAGGYMEQLTTAQCHLLASVTTRRENVKGMLRRIGVPVFLSLFCIFLSSFLLFFAKVTIIKRVGYLLFINTFLIGGLSLFGFSAILMCFGPCKAIYQNNFKIITTVVSLVLVVVLCLAVIIPIVKVEI